MCLHVYMIQVKSLRYDIENSIHHLFCNYTSKYKHGKGPIDIIEGLTAHVLYLFKLIFINHLFM